MYLAGIMIHPVMYSDSTGHLLFFAITAAVGAAIGAIVGGVKAARAGTSVLTGALKGAAIGGTIGLGFGAAAGAALVGNVAATTKAVVAGAKLLGSYVASGGVGAGASYIANNISRYGQPAATAQQVTQKGKIGEAISGITKNTTRIYDHLVSGAKYRIPDGLTETVLSEVKNYTGTLSYTAQLKDFVSYVQNTTRNENAFIYKCDFIKTFARVGRQRNNRIISFEIMRLTRMSNYNYNKNPKMIQVMIENQKKADEEYKRDNPDSLVILFEKRMKELGYEFDTLNQVKGFLPKHKNIIIPIAMELYEQTNVERDKRYFLGLFHYKRFDECIPLMLKDMYSKNISISIKALIAENLREIRSPKYIDDYLRILSMKELSDSRNPIIALVSDFKVEQAIPMLVSALDEGKNITTNALDALGKYKKADLRIYFEKYLNHKNKYYRREAKKAIQKLED